MTTDQAQPGLRERKKLETRDALARAALELVARDGLAGVTVNDIAEAAGVSTRTFFNYFASKEDALTRAPVDPELLVERLADVDPAAPTLDALLAIMRPDIAAVEADPAEWRLRFDVVSANPELLPWLVTVSMTNQRRVADVLAERAAPGDEATRRRAEMLVAAVFAVALHVMIVWHGDEGHGSLVAAVDAAIDAVRIELSPAASPRAGDRSSPAADTDATPPATRAEPPAIDATPPGTRVISTLSGVSSPNTRAQPPAPTSGAASGGPAAPA